MPPRAVEHRCRRHAHGRVARVEQSGCGYRCENAATRAQNRHCCELRGAGEGRRREHDRGGRFRREILLGAGLLFYPLWIGGTALGTLVGDRLGTPEDYGLDGAFAALFLGLALPTLRGRRARKAAVLAAAIVLVLIPFVPAGVPLIAASAACLLGVRR